MKKYKILHVEDVASDAELAMHELKKHNIDFEYLLVDDEDQYLTALNSYKPDIILCDHSLPSFNSFQALTILKEKKIRVPFIIITASMCEDVANEVAILGADDYILKDRLKRLPIAVQNALERYNYENENRELLLKIHQKEAADREELQHLSNTLRLATEIAGIGVWEYYIEGDRVTWDDQMFEMFGLKKSDFKGGYESFDGCLHPDDREHFRSKINSALQTGDSFNVEFRIIKPSDGSTCYLKSQVHIFAEDGQKGRWMLGTIKDITERILSEKKVEESYRLLEGAFLQQATILDSLKAHIALLDNNGNIITVNQAWKNFADQNGLSHNNYLIGGNYFDICNAVTGNDKVVAKAVAKAIKQVLCGEIPEFSTEYTCDSPWQQRWFRVTITPLFSNYSNGVVVSHSNITKRKISEQQLLQQNQALIKANSELDRFVYSASHELRSPLTSVMGLAQIGKEEESSEQCRELFNMIEEAVLGLDHFILDIVNYSRNARTQVESELVDFEQLIQYSIAQLRYLRGSSDIKIHVRVNCRIPFYSDTKRMSIIVNNLISNALKYRKPGNPNSFVKISVVSSQRYLKLQVADNGIGISATAVDRIFDMFYRATNANTGSGLGLYILKETVDKLGGKVSVKSAEGKGTTVTVQFSNAEKRTP